MAATRASVRGVGRRRGGSDRKARARSSLARARGAYWNATPAHFGASPKPGAAQPTRAAPGPPIGCAIVAARGKRNRILGLGAFILAARAYWCSVYPRSRHEIDRWRSRAAAIPDGRLRGLALQALAKRSNMEGAAAFATFLQERRRTPVIRAAVAFQSLYNHLDVLSEQPQAGAVGRAGALHAALPAALHAPLPATSPGFVDREGRRARRSDSLRPDDDGGYLQGLIETCRQAVATLPSYPTARPAAHRAASRVVLFQRLNCGERQGDHRALRRWALSQPHGRGRLAWWETAAAAGSSLGVYVMLMLAANPDSESAEILAAERAYFPWVGALHSMLDQLIDEREDRRTGQRNLARYYASVEQSAERFGWLAREALDRTRSLAGRRAATRHRLIVAAMAGMYLSDPASRRGAANAARTAVLRELGMLCRLAITVFRISNRVRGRPGAADTAQISIDVSSFDTKDPDFAVACAPGKCQFG